MAAFPPPGQQPERPEIVRRNHIHTLADPKERGELQAIVKERDAASLLVTQRQQRDKEQNYQQAFDVMKTARNGPRLDPPGMKPPPVLDKAGEAGLMSAARAQVMTVYKAEQDRTVRPFNQQIDQRLDIARNEPYKPDPKRERQLKNYDQQLKTPLTFKPPDPNDRSR